MAPILLITFNRPEHTRRVLSSIVDNQPQELFVFQDGAREGNSDDREKCECVRTVIETMTKNTGIHLRTFFSNQNHGCGPGPATAISWFFDNVTDGIILEDDAIPHSDFFVFASEMLERYADDPSIMAIGSMKLGNEIYGDGSYYFSKMNHTLCAWATWKRAWQLFDYRLLDFSVKDLNKCLKEYGAHLREREYWCERLEEIHKDALNNSSWDQQFWMTIWRNKGKGILPNANLSTNIGFDELGTHTCDPLNPAANIQLEPILPITHPTSQKIQKKADLAFQKQYFQPWAYGWKGARNLLFRLNKRLKRIVGHKGPWFKTLSRNQHPDASPSN